MAHVVADADELPSGERLFVQVGTLELTVFNVEGTYYAIRNYCPHMEGPVGRGPVGEDDGGDPTISCPFHDWRFNLETGETYFGNSKRLTTYDVFVENGKIHVDV